MKKNSLFTFLLLISFLSFGQSLEISVKKGVVTVNNSKRTPNHLPLTLSKDAKISSAESAILIAHKGTKYAKIYCPCENLTYSAVLSKVNQQAIQGSSYSHVVFSKPIESEQGVQKGSSSRGGGETETYEFNTVDSAFIYNQDYNIWWKFPNPLNYLEAPVIVDMSGNVVAHIGTENSFNTSTLSPGWYVLKFKAETRLEDHKANLTIANPFKILDVSEKADIASLISAIEMQTKEFGDDIFEIYLEDFLLSNRIVGY
jgi:hypothetical protein